MYNLKYNNISKEEFLKLNEEDIMFITNPGRMGDEDGITFVVNEEKYYKIYRIDGWMYPKKDIKEKDRISLQDALKQFPKWLDAWKNGNEAQEKYTYLYMGFGNGLSIDNSIYSEFEPYLNKLVENYLSNHKNKEELKYAAIYSVWENALIEMLKNKNIRLL